MKLRNVSIAIATAVVSISALAAGRAWPCSTFLLESGRHFVLGKNFDFMVKEGCLMVNKRGLGKSALLGQAQNPARWVSRYGSITFNQVAREYPMGGMNEAGLVVEIMWLEGTRYPDPDGRTAVPELQWVQYQLDNCATVDEVIATDDRIRIEPMGKTVHFFVADRSGSAAAIEFIGGRMVCHTGGAFAVPVLTNDTYESSCAYLGEHEGFGGTKAAAGGWASLDRFVTCARMVREARSVRARKLVPRAFDILDAASQGEATVWSIVYDAGKLRIHFRTVGMRAVRIVDLARFDFGCDTPPWALDLEADLEGDVSARFAPYTTDFNRKLVGRTFARYAEAEFMSLPEQMQEALARYPESFDCRAAGDSP